MTIDRVRTVCTIGPACESEEILEQLVIHGMDIARVNFSHGTHEQFEKIKSLLDQFNKKHGTHVETLMDLQGPRMRVGVMPEEGLVLGDDEEVLFTTDPNDKDAIYINDPYLHEDIQPFEPMFLSNGDLELQAIEIKGATIKAKVIRGGTLFSRKGVNLPDTNLTTHGLTEKDIKDVEFGTKIGVDYIAMSFVKEKEDLLDLKKLIFGTSIKVMPKIERKQAITKLDEIISESDVIMVARGDLGIEVPIEEVPLLQKYMIKKAADQNIPSVVATQMLMSMVTRPHPTRAEISDVANAVLDGTWAVMLSDETAFGAHPVRALEYLIQTVRRVERFQKEGKI